MHILKFIYWCYAQSVACNMLYLASISKADDLNLECIYQCLLQGKCFLSLDWVLVVISET